MKKIFLAIIVSFILFDVSAQSNKQIEDSSQQVKAATNSQKTSNSQDILTNLYRVSIDSILGKNHSFSFNSSFYGLDTIFFGKKMNSHKNKNLNDASSEGSNLKKYLNWQRLLNQNSLNISLKGDSSNNLNKVSAGLTITLFNKRDLKYNKLSEAMTLELKNIQEQTHKIHKEIKGSLSTDKYQDFDKDWNNANDKNDYSLLSDDTKKIFEEAKDDKKKYKLTSSDIDHINMILAGKDEAHIFFTQIGTLYSRKPLLTFSPTYTYDISNKQPTYSFDLDFLFSFNPKRINQTSWEGEIKTSYKFLNDTSIKKTNFDNKPFLFSIGINKVLLQDANKQSTMEFKFFGEYDYQFGARPTGVDAYKLTVNSTFRIKVYKSLWLPLTVKYDPKNGNVFGFISITANLGS